MATDQDFRPDLKGMPGRSFRQANPERYKQAQGDVHLIKTLRHLEARTREIKSKLRDHFQRNKSEWVAREALKIWMKRTEAQLNHPAPKMAFKDALDSDSILRQARINVQGRITRRFSELKQIQNRMENTLIRNAVERNDPEHMQQSHEIAMDAEVSMSNASPQAQRKSMRR